MKPKIDDAPAIAPLPTHETSYLQYIIEMHDEI